MEKIKYEGPKSKNALSFKYYNAEEVIAGKTMKEHLKYSMSWWHTLCGEGADPFGKGTIDKSFGQNDPLAMHKAKADYGFELMNSLGIDYYCFHDTDLAPEGETLEESLKYFEEMVTYVEALQKKHNKKLLWATANNFTDKKFMCGAGTSPSVDVFAIAGAKVKACIDATIRLGGTGYVFWGGREGYETLLNTDVAKELDNMAALLTMARDYARKNGFKGDFYLEPKPKEPTKHQYDFDVATCVAFLQKYNLMDDFKMNIEANHATLAGHTFNHELRMAAVNGVFGSVDANQGDMLLGWDTDQFPTNIYDTTLCMYEILKVGGFTNGGMNFDAKTRRASNTIEDITLAYISGMDAMALGLRLAADLIKDGRIDQFVDDRYKSFNTKVGKEITSGKMTLEKLAEYALTIKEVNVESGKQEYLESLLNNIMFK